jgi:hypothetical protein
LLSVWVTGKTTENAGNWGLDGPAADGDVHAAVEDVDAAGEGAVGGDDDVLKRETEVESDDGETDFGLLVEAKLLGEDWNVVKEHGNVDHEVVKVDLEVNVEVEGDAKEGEVSPAVNVVLSDGLEE